MTRTRNRKRKQRSRMPSGYSPTTKLSPFSMREAQAEPVTVMSPYSKEVTLIWNKTTCKCITPGKKNRLRERRDTGMQRDLLSKNTLSLKSRETCWLITSKCSLKITAGFLLRSCRVEKQKNSKAATKEAGQYSRTASSRLSSYSNTICTDRSCLPK